MKTIITFLLITLFISCDFSEEPLLNYKGSVIHEKHDASIRSISICIKDSITHLYKFKTVVVSDLDFNKYKIGDTIK